MHRSRVYVAHWLSPIQGSDLRCRGSQAATLDAVSHDKCGTKEQMKGGVGQAMSRGGWSSSKVRGGCSGQHSSNMVNRVAIVNTRNHSIEFASVFQDAQARSGKAL